MTDKKIPCTQYVGLSGLKLLSNSVKPVKKKKITNIFTLIVNITKNIGKR